MDNLSFLEDFDKVEAEITEVLKKYRMAVARAEFDGLASKLRLTIEKMAFWENEEGEE